MSDYRRKLDEVLLEGCSPSVQEQNVSNKMVTSCLLCFLKRIDNFLPPSVRGSTAYPLDITSSAARVCTPFYLCAPLLTMMQNDGLCVELGSIQTMREEESSWAQQ